MEKPPQHLLPKKGFNLIEIAIVLGVVGMVLGGVWIAAAAVQQSLRTSDTVKGLTQLVQNIQTNLTASQGATIGDRNIGAYIIAGNLAPSNWVKDNSIISPMGPVQIDNKGSPPRMDISFFPVTGQDCFQLLNYFPKNVVSSWGDVNGGLFSISVMTSTWTTHWSTTVTSAGVTIPSTACQSANNRVMFSFNYSRN